MQRLAEHFLAQLAIVDHQPAGLKDAYRRKLKCHLAPRRRRACKSLYPRRRLGQDGLCSQAPITEPGAKRRVMMQISAERILAIETSPTWIARRLADESFAKCRLDTCGPSVARISFRICR